MKNWNSKIFEDLLHQIPKLSMPYSVFKDFPVPGKIDTFYKDFQGPMATLSCYSISGDSLHGRSVTPLLCAIWLHATGSKC